MKYQDTISNTQPVKVVVSENRKLARQESLQVIPP